MRDSSSIEDNKIQSYVANRWLVSTVLMRSSTWPSMLYYETIVWTWDKETKERGHIIYQGEGLNDHFKTCKDLMLKGEIDNENP